VSRYDLVIFDCDGVLVDSERLAVRTETRILNEIGWPLSESEVIDLFVGRTSQAMQEQVERHLGRDIDWTQEFEAPTREVFKRELTPVEGIVEILDALDVPSCVASSGTHERIVYTLSLTGLFERFEGRIFSAEDVDVGKPAPDLFLYAAHEMGVAGSRCVVIEDSVAGVRAAHRANMMVLGFAGGVTKAEDLRAAGARTFLHMSELPSLLGLE
jgi:HAD superfamily hydrolase (TIGR01509 family)